MKRSGRVCVEFKSFQIPYTANFETETVRKATIVLQIPFFLMICFSHFCITWCESLSISITTHLSRNSMKFIVFRYASLCQEADKLSTSHPTGWSLDALHRSVNKRLKLGWSGFLQGRAGWKFSRSHFGHLQTKHKKNLPSGGSFWSLTLLGGQLQCNKSLALHAQPGVAAMSKMMLWHWRLAGPGASPNWIQKARRPH